MKAIHLLLIVLLACSSVMNAQFFHESFLTSDLYQVTMGAEGNDGKSDYFQRVTNDSIDVSYSGADSIFFACQDIDDGGWDGSASPSQLTWSHIDIKDMVKVRFEGLFAEVIQDGGEIDRTDGIVLQYKIDDNDWENLLVLANDGSQYNSLMYWDTDFDAIGDSTCISSAEGTMVKLEQSFFVWGDSLALRISVNLNSGKEDVAFDEFKLFEETVSNIGKPSLKRPDFRLVGRQLYLTGNDIRDVKIYTLSGKLIKESTNDINPITVDNLTKGVYIIRITSESGVISSGKFFIR
ncbi:T9SS type A sorting domain-containing protein [Saccharicrinis sp. FJH2]|uniref:T9SS type A sorting domain-containing protein n=1 Tax=Saccharicrinis sp. FJH65 TaxID=3344659 RepID=UPI0035F44433